MIKKIKINKFRKLEDIEFEFSKGVNIISGTNGTCKTSLLHLISNSFKALNKKNNNLEDDLVLDIIKDINKLINPKIESLMRGDKIKNDPALGVAGTLFEVTYFDDYTLNFRRQNVKSIGRFAIKPTYSNGKEEKLPSIPIVYLGLFRLYSFGEFTEDNKILPINKSLPEKYINEINDLYEDFTKIEIVYENFTNLLGIKNRVNFSSKIDGIDSNTISSGEDNLYIILTALVSLKYYYESLKKSENIIESILLIDEIDATLHPAFQVKLLDLFKTFSEKYKIQFFFTTHSISLLEYALQQKIKVFYLINNIKKASLMPDPNKYKIEMFLKGLSKKDLYLPKKIPVFTEDNEARLFLENILDKLYEVDENFKKVRGIYHLVEANLSSEALKTIFSDDKVLRETITSICILDGDQKSKKDEENKNYIANHIIFLPSTLPPEKLFFEYSIKLYEEKNENFWMNDFCINNGYSMEYYDNVIKKEIDETNEKIRAKKEEKESKGYERDVNKKLFNKYIEFFKFVIKYWLNDETNQDEIEYFIKGFKILFKKVSVHNGINPNDWD